MVSGSYLTKSAASFPGSCYIELGGGIEYIANRNDPRGSLIITVVDAIDLNITNVTLPELPYFSERVTIGYQFRFDNLVVALGGGFHTFVGFFGWYAPPVVLVPIFLVDVGLAY